MRHTSPSSVVPIFWKAGAGKSLPSLVREVDFNSPLEKSPNDLWRKTFVVEPGALIATSVMNKNKKYLTRFWDVLFKLRLLQYFCLSFLSYLIYSQE
jgi:hypothetical protein